MIDRKQNDGRSSCDPSHGPSNELDLQLQDRSLACGELAGETGCRHGADGSRSEPAALDEPPIRVMALQESYKHPHTGQSLSYARMVELEVRLLEKEWTGCPDLFAQLRMR